MSYLRISTVRSVSVRVLFPFADDLTQAMTTVFDTIIEADGFEDAYLEKLTEIHAFAKSEITDFLTPKNDGDKRKRIELLNNLREKLCHSVCEVHSEFGSLELIPRRSANVLADDVYILGFVIVNGAVDKRLKKLFKTNPNAGVGTHADRNDVSLIEQSDLAETCLLLRESVMNLTDVICGLKTDIGSLQQDVSRLEIKLRHRDELLETNRIQSQGTTPETTEIIPDDPTGGGSNGFSLSRSQRRNILNHRPEGTGRSNGIVGKSTEKLSFSASSMAPDANLRSVYIGKTDLHTTTANIRSHLSKIGVGGEVSDVQRVTTRIATENSFCVTVDSVEAENKMYRADWPAKVVIRPYRAPVSHRRNWQNDLKKVVIMM